MSGLSWRHHDTGPLAPCLLCGQPALCRDADGQPCHKVCAERAAVQRADPPADDQRIDLLTTPSNHPGVPEMELRPDAQALLRNAIQYAERGWLVFLLGRTKRPLANCPDCPKDDQEHDREACQCLTCHGFYAATADRDRIQAMCAAHPRGMLAIRTGTASNLTVIDIDPRNGGDLDPALMPRTACVATGGGGWHLYYRHPGGRLAPKLAGHPGVDIKADGGYVVAPPSMHPDTGRPYRWVDDHPLIEMPPALAEACQPAPELTVTAPTSPTPLRRAGGISSPAALLQAHLDAVAAAPQGRRRNTLYGAARGVARMVNAGALTPTDAYHALYDAGVRAQQTHRDIHAAITGGFHAEHLTIEGNAA